MTLVLYDGNYLVSDKLLSITHSAYETAACQNCGNDSLSTAISKIKVFDPPVKNELVKAGLDICDKDLLITAASGSGDHSQINQFIDYVKHGYSPLYIRNTARKLGTLDSEEYDVRLIFSDKSSVLINCDQMRDTFYMRSASDKKLSYSGSGGISARYFSKMLDLDIIETMIMVSCNSYDSNQVGMGMDIFDANVPGSNIITVDASYYADIGSYIDADKDERKKIVHKVRKAAKEIRKKFNLDK